MTIIIPLPLSVSGPSTPSTSTPGSFTKDCEPELLTVVNSIRTARRIVVVCGAGISTAADIPDFRSADGLFGGTGNRKGKGKASVKDLFHVKSLTSPHLLPAHHELLKELASLSAAAEPTAFHSFLNSLDQEGRLLRCYTQNIDGLEARAGLSVGIPAQYKRRRKERADLALDPTLFDFDDSSKEQLIPRCIPLHGQLDSLHCQLCSTVLPLAPFLPLPAYAIPCPTCNLSATIRHALSERQRRVGTLRVSVVLYGEEHPQGEAIGSLVESDLRGKEGKIDFLLVVGTSLAIPGVKRIVKEMARVLHSGRHGKGTKVVYLSDSPPAKMAEWDGVFDVWIKGDIQRFVIDHLSKAMISTPKKSNRKREVLPTPSSTPKRRKAIKKEEECSSDLITPTKAAGKSYLPTPRETPPSRSFVENSLTALSSLSGEEEENPFLNLAKGNVSPEDA